LEGIEMPADQKIPTMIRARRGLRRADLAELWSFRELAWMLAERDVRVRYRHTALGAAWAILRPAITMLIFSAIFGRVAHVPSNGAPYPVFAFVALLPWMFFAQAVSGAAQSISGAGTLITRVYFPRLIVPISALGVALVDFVVALGLLVPLMLAFGVAPNPRALLTPLLLGIAALVSLGAGIWLSAVTVAYRDFKHVEPFLLQMWMLVTPVIYPSSLLPPAWRWVKYANPMAGVVEAFRACWLGQLPDWGALGASVIVGGAVLVTGILYFGRVERRFADLI
jgi:lipopolysaccharide transport system permease protein